MTAPQCLIYGHFRVGTSCRGPIDFSYSQRHRTVIHACHCSHQDGDSQFWSARNALAQMCERGAVFRPQRKANLRELFMMSAKILRRSTAAFALFAGVLMVGSAEAQQMAAGTSRAPQGAGEVETVVVTGTAFDPETAPAKSSLDTTEPQTIISKSYIEDSVAATGTYTSILAIAPSMTGTDLNGPGLSDGGVKNPLRGLPDGNSGINFDGIPFGDTNGPTHHSQSYFPASAIGSVVVDRGPGNAGNMGPSTYGGTVSLFSEELV